MRLGKRVGAVQFMNRSAEGTYFGSGREAVSAFSIVTTIRPIGRRSNRYQASPSTTPTKGSSRKAWPTSMP